MRKEIKEEDFEDIKKFLTKYRNLSDNDFNSTNAMAVWWYTLKLCCDFSGGFIKRLNESYESLK